MANVSQELIDRIRDAADIVTVISPYVNLRKQGQNYVGLCPFHDDRHPSLHVSQRKQIFKCFACGAGGNAISFLMEYEKISFLEALRRLGDQVGIPVTVESHPEQKDFIAQLYDLHDAAADLYTNTLFSERGRPALAYLKDRGLSEEIIREFRLGLAPNQWDFAWNYFQKRKIRREVLQKSGLFTFTEKGQFDRFRNRILFPISNLSGRIVAFGGRALDDDPAKYLNSPESPIYHKSEILYGLHRTRDVIRKADQALLVEGYMDFLQLYQHGIHHLAAVSGTALAEQHARLLRKYVRRVTVVYDGDEAGQKAALRAGYLLLREGIDARVLVLPDQEDPDEWVRRVGRSGVMEALPRALEVIPFHCRLKQASALRGPARAALVQDMVEEIAGIRDGILRAELLRQAAEELRVDEGELTRRLDFLRARRQRPAPGGKPAPAEEGSLSGLEKAQVDLIRILTGPDPEARSRAMEMIKPEQFTDPVLQQVVRQALKKADPAALVDLFTDKADRERVAAVLVEATPYENAEQMVVDCVKKLEIHHLKEEIARLRTQMKQMEAREEDPESLLLEVARLQQELRYVQNR